MQRGDRACDSATNTIESTCSSKTPTRHMSGPRTNGMDTTTSRQTCRRWRTRRPRSISRSWKVISRKLKELQNEGNSDRAEDRRAVATARKDRGFCKGNNRIPPVGGEGPKWRPAMWTPRGCPKHMMPEVEADVYATIEGKGYKRGNLERGCDRMARGF